MPFHAPHFSRASGLVLVVGIAVGAVAHAAVSAALTPKPDASTYEQTIAAPKAEPNESHRTSSVDAISRDGAPGRRVEAALSADDTPGDSQPMQGASGSPLDALRAQIALLERRIAALEGAQIGSRTRTGSGVAAAADDDAPRDEPIRLRTAEDRQLALVRSGVSDEQAREIVERDADLELARLELRDRATREGWAASARLRQEMASLDEEAVDLRTEVGDAVYDLYLFHTGAANRVRVTSVIGGSSADQYGLLPGDIVETYDDRAVFTPSELQQATTRGERDETVPVMIRRGEAMFQTWLPRGPIGVRIAPARVDPMP